MASLSRGLRSPVKSTRDAGQSSEKWHMVKAVRNIFFLHQKNLKKKKYLYKMVKVLRAVISVAHCCALSLYFSI